MAKFYGKIGYTETAETDPGIWEPTIVEREYMGDISNEFWKRQNNGEINDDIELTDTISIIADPYAIQHCSSIAYVEYVGAKWKVNKVDIQYPRLLLSLGGVWNE